MQQTNFLLLTRYSCAVRRLCYGCRLSSLGVFCRKKKTFCRNPFVEALHNQNFSDLFKGTFSKLGGKQRAVGKLCVFNGKVAMSGKRLKIGPSLLLSLITDKKWHTSFQMRWKSSTWNDVEGQYCNRNCI